MKHHLFTMTVLAGLTFTSIATPADSVFTNFITAHDGKLYDGANEFRFLSFDIPNLLLVEDNVPFKQKNPWRLPDAFEINDALATVADMGGTVARTYVISVIRTNDLPGTPRHVLGPGKFNEAAFRTLDQVIATANRTGVRLIIPLVDNWPWMGGRAEYAGFRGKTKNDFWTDPQLIADFEQTIHYILTRKNTITGVRYCDDPAVLCWETGNEIESPASWTREIAHYIKSLDAKHLVMDGFNASTLRKESLEIPEVDIVTTHHYPGRKESFSELIQSNAVTARGKKPYIIGEFGFASSPQMAATIQTIRDSGISGGMLWSLRFRDRDGGFYWHSEPDGASLYKAFHWPGSALGDPYDEIRLMDLVRSNAFAIRGLPVPPVPVPLSPKLLPIGDAAAISWQGSVGASDYQVERTAAPFDGHWEIIATNVDEAFTQYRPQFSDETAPTGRWYYRIRAQNASGISEPSNVEAVKVKDDTMVDELADFSKVQSKQGDWALRTGDCRRVKEDAHRAAGRAGDELVYQMHSPITGFHIFAYFRGTNTDMKCSISTDGSTFQDVPVHKEDYFDGAGDYNYWHPIEFSAQGLQAGQYLKIALTDLTEIGHVEITHTANP